MRKFYICRESRCDNIYDDYKIGGNKKAVKLDYIYSFCPWDFEKLTGLKLKPGEIVQCELKIVNRKIIKKEK